MPHEDVRLTTFDNPWNPYTQYESWYRFDVTDMGYCTDAYVARIAHLNDEAMSEEENDREWERAIDEIIKYDFRNIYRKVTPSSYN